MTVTALVLAAGRGERFGGDVSKAFVTLAGRTLLAHAVEALAASPEIHHVVPVVPTAALPDLGRLVPELADEAKVLTAVAGGSERQDSMRAGLSALPAATEWVAVHDAARPLVRPEQVSAVVQAAREEGAAILALPVRDTLKRVEDGCVIGTTERAGLWTAQTPQVFRKELLIEALAKAESEGRMGTDDSQLVEALGVRVRVVPGDPENAKITLSADLLAAEAWLAERSGARS